MYLSLLVGRFWRAQKKLLDGNWDVIYCQREGAVLFVHDIGEMPESNKKCVDSLIWTKNWLDHYSLYIVEYFSNAPSEYANTLLARFQFCRAKMLGYIDNIGNVRIQNCYDAGLLYFLCEFNQCCLPIMLPLLELKCIYILYQNSIEHRKLANKSSSEQRLYMGKSTKTNRKYSDNIHPRKLWLCPLRTHSIAICFWPENQDLYVVRCVW